MKSVRIQIFYAALLALILMSGLTVLCYEAYGNELPPEEEVYEEKYVNYCTQIPGYRLFMGCGQAEWVEGGERAEACAHSCPEHKGNYQELYSDQVCEGPGQKICCCKG